MTTPSDAMPDAVLFGNRFSTQEVPSREFPDNGMTAVDAMRLVAEDLALEGDPARNLATFVTTWMEPEAQRSSPQTCTATSSTTPNIRARRNRAALHPDDRRPVPRASETTGARTQGSSEAIMLGGLSLKWNWRKRREAAGESTANPNLVFGGDVHVVWEKFCRYFDVEPRIVPLQPGKYTIGPDDVSPHIDENTIGVAAVLGTTFTGHKDDIVGINNLLLQIKTERGRRPVARGRRERRFRLAVPLSRLGMGLPSGAGTFHQRLRTQVRAGLSRHRLADLREKSDLAQDLVFEENYLGKTDATFTLNFSTGSAMVWRSTTTSSATAVPATPTS